MKDFWDDSVKNDKAVKIFLRISKALYADHVITQRQLRTMLLSGCAINYLCQYICLSVSLSSRLRCFLYIIHTARNCAQGMRMQATGSNPLSGSIILPSVRPFSCPWAFWYFCICINIQYGVPASQCIYAHTGVQSNSVGSSWAYIYVHFSVYLSGCLCQFLAKICASGICA